MKLVKADGSGGGVLRFGAIAPPERSTLGCTVEQPTLH